VSTSFSGQQSADNTYFPEPSLRQILGDVYRQALTKPGQESYFSTLRGDRSNLDMRMRLWWFKPLPITAGDTDYLQLLYWHSPFVG